jgi:DMSO/TMAO reductase YedYZ heme-binding membrane subunit
VKTDPTFWIAARAAGLAAYAMLTCSVVAGLVLKSRPFGARLKPSTVTDLHRFLALLGLGAIALHGILLTLDTAVPIPWTALVVPGQATYRRVWTAAGVVSAEAMIVVYLSFGIRKHIGIKNWRRLHWTTYVIFAGATLHGLLGGSDSNRSWALYLYLGSVGLVITATVWRALVPPPRPERTRVAQPASA